MTNEKRTSTLFGPIGILLFLGATGCGDGASYDLLSGDPEGASVFSRSDLRVRLPNGQIREDVTEALLSQFLTEDCKLGPVGADITVPARTCVVEGRNAYLELCVANRLVEFADNPAAQPLRRLASASDAADFAPALAALGEAVMLPPERAQQAALLTEARASALRAATAAVAGKTTTQSGCVSGGSAAINWPDHKTSGVSVLNLDEHLAASLIEANQLIVETSEKLVRALLAPADRRMGDTASPQEIARRVWVGDGLTKGRFDVSHAIASGALGLPAASPTVRDDGMCPITALNSSEKRALGALRQSGVSSSTLASTGVSNDTLLSGVGGVRERLAVLRSDDRLLTAPPAPLTPLTNAQFLDYLGVTASDVAAARRYLVQEFAAFGRTEITIPFDYVPGSNPPTPLPFVRSAATLTEPAVPNAAYWGALASLPSINFGANPQTVSDVTDSPSFVTVTGSAPAGSATGEDLLLAYAAAALETVGRDGTSSASLGADARSLISSQLPELERRYRGLVRTCVENGSSAANKRATLRIYHRMATPTFSIVQGHAGLQCATTGFVEGVRCNLATYAKGVFQAEVTSGFPIDPSFTKYRPATIDMSSLGTPGPIIAPVRTLLFVVYNEAGIAAGAGPGLWTVFTGQALTLTPTDAVVATLTPFRTYCVDRPAIEGLDEVVAQILAPNAQNCTQPATSCAGIPSNQLIPLENDLTSDGDPVESSWRQYLDSALTAADVADGLGEQLIREGLEQDARVESAVDELAAACGARINLDSIVGATGLPRTAGVCTVGGTACTTGYACIASPVNGICTIDPVALAISRAASDADAARLQTCLGATDIGSVSLGSETLCAWTDSTGVLCGRAGSPAGLNADCPYAVTAGAACTTLPTTVPPYRPVGPTQGLGYFAEDPEPVVPPREPEGEPPCRQLAQLRSPSSVSMTPADGLRLLQASQAVIRGRQWWSTTAVAAAASRLNWRPLPGDFSEVTLDGGRWIRLGSLTGATVGRPCDNTPVMGIPCSGTEVTSGDPATSGSLFCVRDLCDTGPTLLSNSLTRAQRAKMNDRLARAVIAARIIAGVPLAGVEVPTYPFFRGADTEGDYWARFRGATWSAVTTLESQQIYSATNGEIFGQLSRNFPLSAGARAYYVGGGELYPAMPSTTIPAYAEYTLNAFDGTRFEIFDSAGINDEPNGNRDADDPPTGPGFDFNVPMIVRALPASVDGANVAPNAALIWSGLNGTPAARTGGPPVRVKNLIERLRTRRAASVTTVVLGLGMGVSNYWRNYDEGNDDWYDNVDYASDAGIDHNFTPSGNRAFIARNGLTEASVLDAVELICAAQLSRRSAGSFSQIPEIKSVEDLGTFSEYLRVESTRSQGQAARVIFEGYPLQAIVNADSSGADTGGSGDGLAGDFGGLVATLRTQMNALADQKRIVAVELSLLANDTETLQNALDGLQADRLIVDLQLQKEIMNQMTACVTAVAASPALDPAAGAGKALAAAVTCVNSLMQANLSSGIARAQTRGLDADEAQAVNVAEAAVRVRSRGLGSLATEIRGSIEQLRGTLRQIESTRARGRRALAKALMLDADETGAEYAVDTAMRRRLNTTAIRYDRAFKNATRQAYIAKLAIEQRIGMPLSSITTPMRLLDEPPAGWQMDVCSMTGIDYDRIRDSAVPPAGELPDGGLPDGATAPSFDDYSGEYIGDYVRKLELVMRSYPFDFPYAPSTDTAVISLRDEIMHIRTDCPTPVNNLLYQSGHLDVRPDLTTGAAGWATDGCPVTGGGDVPDGGVSVPPAPCITTIPVPVSATCNEIGTPTELGGPIQPFEVRFGEAPVKGDYTKDSRLVQWVTLDPGVYRLSWYGKAAASDLVVQIRRRRWVSDPFSTSAPVFTDELLPDAFVVPEQLAGLGFPDAVDLGSVCMSPGGWKRFYRMFQIDRRTEIGVAVDPPDNPAVPTSYFVAGLMVEDVSSLESALPAVASRPGAYMDTRETRTRSRPTCEDIDGVEFRRTGFSRGCDFLCANGLGEGCTGISAEPRCYWETQFSVTQRQIERGELIRGGGFAYGNFNYRIEDIALNVVGTYARDCEQARALGYTSAVCYANGTVPYSLYHTGDFTVRNHAGDDYDAPLFNGAIEYARALATEDYITNPISSASASRLEPFRKREFSGRPINGTYTLRIWDDPAVDFSSIDDIQIVMNYRYWTRFGR